MAMAPNIDQQHRTSRLNGILFVFAIVLFVFVVWVGIKVKNMEADRKEEELGVMLEMIPHRNSINHQATMALIIENQQQILDRLDRMENRLTEIGDPQWKPW